jgi:hypothetical protein
MRSGVNPRRAFTIGPRVCASSNMFDGCYWTRVTKLVSTSAAPLTMYRELWIAKLCSAHPGTRVSRHSVFFYSAARRAQ